MYWQSLRKRVVYPLKSMGIGAAITVLNVPVLMLLVSGFGIFPALANLIRFVVTAQLHFYLEGKISPKSNDTSSWQRWYRFQLLKSGSTVAKQAGFLALTAWAGTHYLLAYGICTVIAGALGLLFKGLAAPTAVSEPDLKLEAPA